MAAQQQHINNIVANFRWQLAGMEREVYAASRVDLLTLERLQTWQDELQAILEEAQVQLEIIGGPLAVLWEATNLERWLDNAVATYNIDGDVYGDRGQLQGAGAGEQQDAEVAEQYAEEQGSEDEGPLHPDERPDAREAQK
eukprot:Colp12_sorted_trinity150504_noHs@25539